MRGSPDIDIRITRGLQRYGASGGGAGAAGGGCGGGGSGGATKIV